MRVRGLESKFHFFPGGEAQGSKASSGQKMKTHERTIGKNEFEDWRPRFIMLFFFPTRCPGGEAQVSKVFKRKKGQQRIKKEKRMKRKTRRKMLV